MEDLTPKSISQRGDNLGLSHLAASSEISSQTLNSALAYADSGSFRSEMAQLRSALDAALAEIADLRTATSPPLPIGNLNSLESGLLEADSARLRAQLLEARNADLTVALDAAMTEMANFIAERAAIDAQRREIAALRDQLATTHLALESHNESMDEFAATRLELDMLRQDHQRKLFELQGKVDSAEAALKRAQIESASLAEERHEAATLRTRLDQAESERAHINEEFARLSSVHAAIQQEMEGARAQAADANRLRNALETANIALEQAATANDANEAENTRLRQELRDANDALLAAVASRDALNTANDRLQADLTAMRNELDLARGGSEQLQSQLSELSARNQEMAAQHQRLLSVDDEFRTLQAEAELLRGEVAARTQAQSEAAQATAQLSATLESMRAERDALRATAAELPSIAGARDSALADLHQALAANSQLESECEQMRAQIAELATVNHELHTARKQLQSDMDLQSQSLADADAKRRQTLDEQVRTREQLRIATDTANALETQVAQVRALLAEREADIRRLQGELEQLAVKEHELQLERTETGRLRGHLSTLALMSADSEIGSARLRRQQRLLQRHLESTRESLAGAVARGVALEETDSRLRQREEELEAARATIADVTTRNEALLSQLSDHEQKIQSLLRERDDAIERAARRNAHAETLQSQLDASAAEARNRIERLRVDLDETTTYLRHKESESETYRQQHESSANRLTELESKLREKVDANDALTRQLSIAEEQQRKSEADLTALKNMLKAADVQADQLRQQNADSDRLREKLQQTADALRQKEGESETYRHQCESSEKQIAELNLRLRQGEAANSDLRRQLLASEESRQKSDSALAEIQGRFSAMGSQSEQLRQSGEESERLRGEISRLGTLTDDQWQELAKLRRQLAGADAMQSQMAALREEMARLTDKLTESREQTELAQADAHRHLRQLADSQQLLAQAETEVNRLKQSATSVDSSEVKRLKARMQAQAENRQRQLEELAAVRRSLAEAEAQRRQLQAELETAKLRR